MKKLLSLLLVCALLCGCSEQGAQTTTTTTTASTTTTTTSATTTPQATTTTTTPQTTTTPETTTTIVTTEPIDTVEIAENYKYTDEDLELQKLLAEKNEKVNLYLKLDVFGYFATKEEAEKDGVDFSIYAYDEKIVPYILQTKEFPFNTLDEVEADVNSFFSKDIAEKLNYMLMNGTDIVPILAEKDNRIYRFGSEGRGGYDALDFSRSKVISKTEDEIVFSFLMPEAYTSELNYCAFKGVLKYEDGEWKVGFDFRYPEGMDFAEVWGNT